MAKKNSKSGHDGPHKYVRSVFKNTGTVIFRCELPDCSHFIYEPLIIGRLSVCYRCNGIFIITKKTIKAKKLHCEPCSRGRYNKIKEVKKIVGNVSDSDVDKLLYGIEQIAEDDDENKQNRI